MLPAPRNAPSARACACSAHALLLVAIAFVGALSAQVRLVAPVERSARVALPLGSSSSPTCEPQPGAPRPPECVVAVHLPPRARLAVNTKLDVAPVLTSPAGDVDEGESPGRTRARLMVFLL